MAALALLAGCAGREPHIPPVAQGGDFEKDCTALVNEMIANANSADAKIKAQKSRDQNDIAIGVAGALLFWPALFAIDTKNAEGHEGNALLDRNQHLMQIAAKKGCDTTPVPTVIRYD